MPGPIIAKGLQHVLKKVFSIAKKERYEYVTLEHLLLALLDDVKVIQALEQLQGNPKKLKKNLQTFIEQYADKLPSDVQAKPQQTLAVDRVLHKTILHAVSAETSMIESTNVLVQLLEEKDSHAAWLLKKEGIRSLALKYYISHGQRKSPRWTNINHTQGNNELEEDDVQKTSVLENFTVDLIQEAKAENIDPLIGREKEIQRAIQVLCRRRKNNPIFVGDPGVGKTSIVEGIALQIHREEVPSILKNARIFSLNIGGLIAGTKFRGQLEERIKALIHEVSKYKQGILFIDEIHCIVGAGATIAGHATDLANLLKPALIKGTIRCMGATTFKEYKSIERDVALARRLQKIEVQEPSKADAINILKGLQKHYEEYHKVHYEDKAIEAAVHLSAKYIHQRFLPDKAIDIIDEAGAFMKIHAASNTTPSRIGVQDIEQAVSMITRIPAATMTTNEQNIFQRLRPTLRKYIFGQDEAIDIICDAIALSKAGLRAQNKTIASLLFSGPTGVGKTELANRLAKAMNIKLVRFDMSEYVERHSISRLIGAPPGYVGFEQGGLLTDAVRKTPHAVVVMDEIEKAHFELFNILLQVMDHAKLTDNNGLETDFQNVILILTTNAGAKEANEKIVGFDLDENPRKQALRRATTKDALKRTFSPEFRNRLDHTIFFDQLSKENIKKVVQKEVNVVAQALQEKNIEIHLTPATKTWLANHGYDPQMGARPLARLIEKTLKKPIAKALLFGHLRHGGHIKTRIKNNELVLEYS